MVISFSFQLCLELQIFSFLANNREETHVSDLLYPILLLCNDAEPKLHCTRKPVVGEKEEEVALTHSLHPKPHGIYSSS